MTDILSLPGKWGELECMHLLPPNKNIVAIHLKKILVAKIPLHGHEREGVIGSLSCLLHGHVSFVDKQNSAVNGRVQFHYILKSTAML